MKPTKLKIKGFMTFNKETEIDFSAFGTVGLFLITGDTGAGKSTIFDAITYALFGEVSGNLRCSLNPVSDFLKDGEESFVELEFSHRNKSYKVKRNPEYMGKKKKGNGLKKIDKNAMLLFDDKEITGNTGVTSKIIEILGINRDQFKQISMLAQGEFMNLLNAESKTRGLILRKIFNTDIYESFTKKLESIKSNFSRECTANDTKIIQILKGLDFDEKSVGYEEIKNWIDNGSNINNVLSVMDIIREMNVVDCEELLKLKEIKDSIDTQYKKAEVELSEARAANLIFQRKENLEAEKIQLLKEKELIKEKENTLDLILRAKKVKGFYESYTRENNNLKECKKELEKNQNILEDLKEKADDIKAVFEKAKKDLPTIERFSAEILKERENLKDYDELSGLNENLNKCFVDKKAIDKKYKIIEGGILTLTKNLEDDINKIEKLKNCVVDLANCQNELKNKNQELIGFNELLNKYNKISKNKILVQNNEKEFFKSEKEYSSASEKYEKARALFLLGQAGIMAQALTDEEECPVCGSKNHPRKAKLIDDTPKEEDIKNLENNKNEKDKISREKNNILRECKGQLESEIFSFINDFNRIMSVNIDNKNYTQQAEIIISEAISSVKNDIKSLEIKEKALVIDSKELSDLEKEKKELESRIKNGENQFEDVKLDKAENEKKSIELKGKIQILSTSLKFKDKNEALNKLNQKIELKNNLQRELENAEKKFNDFNTAVDKQNTIIEENKKSIALNKNKADIAERDYNEKLLENKFSSEEMYLKTIKTEKIEDEINNYIQEFKNKELKNKTSLEEIDKNLNGKKYKDLEKITERCKMLLEDGKKSEKEFLRLYKKTEVNQAVFKNVTLLWKSQEKTRTDFLNADELYKTASGTLTGKNRISIENYVQAFYFKRIIQEANKRLTVMTEGQYELLRKDSATKRSNEAFALDLVVYDYYTAKSRDVSALSGGEAFKAALSLALGLSDVIQQEAGGIEIDAVFIDEGFGSLDSDSLEQAISVLCELSEGNRLVGIISHVNELKEKINDKIIVKKTLEGSSINIT